MANRVTMYLDDEAMWQLEELEMVYPTDSRSRILSRLIWSRHKEVENGIKRIKRYQDQKRAKAEAKEKIQETED